MSLNPYELAALCANLAEEKKAKEIRVLQTENVSVICDYFVIATVDSRTQMTALTNSLLEGVKKLGGQPTLGHETDTQSGWSLLDFGDVVVHLFNGQSRQYYQLEQFWSHAREIPQQYWSSQQISIAS